MLDCVKGFWQIKVSDRTKKYLTFATPWGRYAYNRVPFGISLAPEIFQEIMSSILSNVPNVKVAMDDIFIHATTTEELAKTTTKVLKILKESGFKLNREKCVFNRPKVKFLGHIITATGLEIDPDKVEAIKALKSPSNRFIPNLSKLTEPLRNLLKKETVFQWETDILSA